MSGALLEDPPESDDLLKGTENAVTDGLDAPRMGSRPLVSTKAWSTPAPTLERPSSVRVGSSPRGLVIVSWGHKACTRSAKTKTEARSLAHAEGICRVAFNLALGEGVGGRRPTHVLASD